MTSTPYNPLQAVFCSNMVELAYGNFNKNQPNPPPPKLLAGWTFVGNLQVDLNLLGTMYYIGFVTRNPATAETAIVFLGTEDLEWFYDGDALKTPHPLAGNVESGMFDMFNSMTFTPQSSSTSVPFASFLTTLNPTQLTYVTGHSLGGALTTFTAAAIMMLPAPPTGDQLQVYSIASPRVGDAAFVAKFNAVVPNNFRIFNIHDYVPMLPPEDLGYVHVATAQPVPPLDSWQYPVYQGWNPITAAGCYHSHAVYNYMLKERAGLKPAPQEMGSCYVAKPRTSPVQIGM
jgi:triacylglycerol lipase